MSTDLRAALVKAFRGVPIDAPPEDYALTALPAVAEWLRAEADELRRPLPGRQHEGDSYRHIEANALDLRAKRLADSLTTQPSTEEQQ